jgi:hypothetical protein
LGLFSYFSFFVTTTPPLSGYQSAIERPDAQRLFIAQHLLKTAMLILAELETA